MLYYALVEKARKVPSYARYFHWFLHSPKEMPLCTDLDQTLPLPELKNAKILWPNRYRWNLGKWQLNLLKRELSRFVRLENYDVSDKEFAWHREGGFPIPDACRASMGSPNSPKGQNDIRGEIFEVCTGERLVRCAYDYSDYPVISSEILSQVDVYFKCIAPLGQLSQKVVKIGYFAANPLLLSKARAQVLRTPPIKEFDIYGRFGSWTDSQPLRETILKTLHSSSVRFRGGFGRVIYPEYLQELARTQIAIHLAGQGPLSYRLVESMALGALVVSPKLECDFPENLVDGVHYVAIKSDGSDVVRLCQELLQDNERRRAIVTRAMSFFDLNFSPQSVARRILRAVVQSKSFS